MTQAAANASRPWLAEFLLLAAVWGSSFLFMRLATVEFGALPTAALRVAIAVLFLLPILLAQGLGPQLRRHWKPVFLAGVLNSAIPFVCFSFALLHITTGLSSILNATVPLFGALIAWVWLKDRLDRARVLGLVLGFAGVALVASDKAGLRSVSQDAPATSLEAIAWTPMLAVGACLLATFCYGWSASYTKRYLSGMPSMLTATGSQMGATLFLALPAVWFWPAQTPALRAWLALIAVGVLCTGLAYVLYFRLIESTGPARALTVTFVIPVFALGYGVAFLGETITGWMVFCGAIILLGTALSTGLLRPR